MDTQKACLRFAGSKFCMRYCRLLELNTSDLWSRTLLCSSERCVFNITAGYYVIYCYSSESDDFYDARRNLKNIRSLQYQIRNIHCYTTNWYVIAKFADCDFTQHIDITLDDPVIKMISSNKLSPELAEQLRIHDAQ